MQAIPAAALAVLCLSGTALGDLELTWERMAAHEAVHYTYNDSFSWDSDARARNQFAFAGTLTFADSPLKLLCIELQQTVIRDPVLYETGAFDPLGPEFGRSRILSSLFAQYYDSMVASDSNAWAAAFAMMTWEIMSENFSSDSAALSEIDLDRGAVQFDGFSAEADGFFAQMLSNLEIAAESDNLVTYRNDSYQDFVGQVPSPGALSLLVLSGLATSRRRRD